MKKNTPLLLVLLGMSLALEAPAEVLQDSAGGPPAAVTSEGAPKKKPKEAKRGESPKEGGREAKRRGSKGPAASPDGKEAKRGSDPNPPKEAKRGSESNPPKEAKRDRRADKRPQPGVRSEIAAVARSSGPGIKASPALRRGLRDAARQVRLGDLSRAAQHVQNAVRDQRLSAAELLELQRWVVRVAWFESDSRIDKNAEELRFILLQEEEAAAHLAELERVLDEAKRRKKSTVVVPDVEFLPYRPRERLHPISVQKGTKRSTVVLVRSEVSRVEQLLRRLRFDKPQKLRAVKQALQLRRKSEADVKQAVAALGRRTRAKKR